MSLNIDFGNGSLGTVEVADGLVNNVNSYVRALKFTGNTALLDLETLIEGKFSTFKAGTDVLIHISSATQTTAEFLGKYLITKITLAQADTFTFDADVESFFEGVDFSFDNVQIISIPDFDSFYLKTGAIVSPPPYNPFHFTGGILILRTFNDLVFEGGHIQLTDCGIPFNRQNTLRPLTSQETAANGESDYAKFSGQENFITKEKFLLNAGDGAVMLIAKTLKCNEDSRIGNPSTHGAAYCRGHKTSRGIKPSNITNIGGSSIFIAADSIENFTPKIIAKYRRADLPAGKGLCRCYIASNSKLPVDEGLYSFDILHNFNRVRDLGIENFGNGNFGDLVNVNAPFNNYAKVIAVTQGGCRFIFADKTLNGLAPLREGSLVIAQTIQKNLTKDAGRFTVARILNVQGDSFILDKPLNVDATNYYVQIISVPEFNNVTLNIEHTATRNFNNGFGGVFALSVADILNLVNGKILVEGKGGAPAFDLFGNSQSFNLLPMGSGNGSIFILAKKIIMNENTRLGASYSGLGEGGRFGGSNPSGSNIGGGYSGYPDTDNTGAGAGFIFGGNNPSLKGAHLMIIADRIEGFTQAAISTGGKGATGATNGAASFGGGSSTLQGGNGGFAFLYCNNF